MLVVSGSKPCGVRWSRVRLGCIGVHTSYFPSSVRLAVREEAKVPEGAGEGVTGCVVATTLSLHSLLAPCTSCCELLVVIGSYKSVVAATEGKVIPVPGSTLVDGLDSAGEGE
ncbi:hypothetical protein V6N13_082047 [Hibiscus sabdariffa]|uniref:Uncharacterized protein n=1 Tax=Hibiscus sabdariffa TaxID=183260 RepID=A0ABR2DCX6_9ROSI